MSLKGQKRLAADILNTGVKRVWINPDYIDKVGTAITRDEVKRLIHERIIKKRAVKGVSKGRKSVTKRSQGKRKSSSLEPKRIWISGIRKQRIRLKELRDGKNISKSAYKKLYLMAKGGAFRSIAHLNEYLESRKLVKRR